MRVTSYACKLLLREYEYKKCKHLYKTWCHCPKKHTNTSRQFHHTVTLFSDTYFDPFLNCLSCLGQQKQGG